MAFKNLSLSSRSRHITSVSSFAGVDYATQRFKVDSNRAIELNNFIYKDGTIQKRQGIEELFLMKPTNYIVVPFDDSEEKIYKTNDVNFNGLWSFK